MKLEAEIPADSERDNIKMLTTVGFNSPCYRGPVRNRPTRQAHIQ